MLSGLLLEVSGEMVAGLLQAAGIKSVNRFRPSERQKALRACVDGALLAAEATLPTDTSSLSHYYIEQLKQAITQPAFCEQLLALIDLPRLDEAIVAALTNTLRQQFIAITQGYDPEQIDDFPFDAFVLALLTGFYSTAKQQPIYQQEIQINLLMGVLKQSEQLVADNADIQTSLTALEAKLDEKIVLSTPNVPMQLPPKTERFVGRERLVEQVQSAVQTNRVVTLWGPGGRGKTAVAWKALSGLQASGELTYRFPDGVLFHSFYGRPLTDVALIHFAESLGIENVRDPIGACQRALNGKRVLLILDGAEDADDLRRVLDVRGECGVLITTRNQNQAPNHDHLTPVNQLELEDAVTLVQTWGGKINDVPTVEAICKEVGRLALAVRLSGILIGKMAVPAREFLAWLQEDVFDALVDEKEGRSRNVERLLARTIQQVGEDGATILTIAGQIAFVPFGEHLLRGVLSDWKRGRLLRAVAKLVDYGLLKREQMVWSDDHEQSEFLKSTDFWVRVDHALVYRYVAELPPPSLPQQGRNSNTVPEEAVRAEQQLLTQIGNYYNHFARVESRRGLSGYNVLDGERTHVMALLPCLIGAEQWHSVNRLAWAIAANNGYLDQGGHSTERIVMLKAGVKATRALENRKEEGAHMGNLGIAYMDIGQVEEALVHHKKALFISQEIKNRHREWAELGNLGNTYWNLGQIEEALTYYQEALTISREVGDRRGEGNQLGSLGNLYRDLGQLEQAINYTKEAVAISRETDDSMHEEMWLCNLGNVYADLGEMEKAIAYYEQALVLSRKTGNRRAEGINLGNLGLAYKSLRQMEDSIANLDQALIVSVNIGDRVSESRHLGNLADVYVERGEYEKAMEMCQRALVTSREIGASSIEASQLWTLGWIYRETNRMNEARTPLQQALTIFEQIQSPHAGAVRQWLADLP